MTTLSPEAARVLALECLCKGEVLHTDFYADPFCVSGNHSKGCPCHGTGRRFWMLVRECDGCGGTGAHVSKGPSGPYDGRCGPCDGSGYVTHITPDSVGDALDMFLSRKVRMETMPEDISLVYLDEFGEGYGGVSVPRTDNRTQDLLKLLVLAVEAEG